MIDSEKQAFDFVGKDELQRRREQNDYQRGLLEWLEGHDWTHVLTCTFPYLVSTWNCLKIARALVRSFQSGETILFALGIASSNNGSSDVHLHVLLRAPGLVPGELELTWKHKTRGDALCTVYSPCGGAELYMLKQWDEEHWDVISE